jgi:hypothetical protein
MSTGNRLDTPPTGIHIISPIKARLFKGDADGGHHSIDLAALQTGLDALGGGGGLITATSRLEHVLIASPIGAPLKDDTLPAGGRPDDDQRQQQSAARVKTFNKCHWVGGEPPPPPSRLVSSGTGISLALLITCAALLLAVTMLAEDYFTSLEDELVAEAQSDASGRLW